MPCFGIALIDGIDDYCRSSVCLGKRDNQVGAFKQSQLSRLKRFVL